MTKDKRTTVHLSQWLSDRISELQFPKENRSQTIRRLLQYARSAIEAQQTLPELMVQNWSPKYKQQFRWDDELADWVKQLNEQRFGSQNYTINWLLTIAALAGELDRVITGDPAHTINWFRTTAALLPPAKPLTSAWELEEGLDKIFSGRQEVELPEVMEAIRQLPVSEAAAKEWLLELRDRERLLLIQRQGDACVYFGEGSQLKYTHLIFNW